jgi:hypothetical protein
MWVPLSQKPMQAASVSPPPPAVLGADSLGLELEAFGEVTVSVRAVPPLDAMVEAGGGDKGATAEVWGAGAAMADGGNASLETVGVAGAETTAAAIEALVGVVLIGGWDARGEPVCLEPGGVDTVASGANWRCDVAAFMRPLMPPCPPPRASAVPGRKATTRPAASTVW